MLLFLLHTKESIMSSTDRILQMVSERNHPTYPLTQDRVTVGAPLVEQASEYNTRATMRARGTASGYTGQVDLFYTRVSMTALGVVNVWQEAPFTVNDLMSKINIAKNAQMTADDVTNVTIPPIATGEITPVMLSAKDTSLVWLGNTQVNVLYGIPASAPDLFDFLDNHAAGLFR
jgi:hypothetical protein